MENLRRSSRIDAQHFIAYDILDEKNQVVQSGMALSRDLSRTGIQMQDRAGFPLDAKVLLHLAVGDDVVDIEGKVRHVDKVAEDDYRIGIEFASISEELLALLEKAYPGISKK
ncbi:hypothetical protein B1H10_09035 [candidate division KSB1 bacterium 4484_188]|nr:MAG: hypothetical protein B1H10_09035 [candidate division KSB1 bacterium 4484_188]HFE64268.1 PilZ domain-containing protein [Caldithrix sp.]